MEPTAHDAETPERAPPRDVSPDPFSPAPVAEPPAPRRVSPAQAALQLRWLRFRMPEVKGAVADMSGLAAAVAALPVLPAQIRDPAFVVVLDASAAGFVRSVVAALAAAATDGSARAAANLCSLLGVAFAAFGAAGAMARGIVDSAMCLRALASCPSAAEATALAAMLHAAGVATAADVVRCTARHMFDVAHKAEEWRMGHALVTSLAALTEIRENAVAPGASSVARSATASREQSVTDTPNTEPKKDAPAPSLPAKNPSAGSMRALDALADPTAADVSSIGGITGPRAAPGSAPDIKTIASPRGIRFPSRVPNAPTPAATLIVAATVVSWRRAQLQLPLPTTVLWLCNALKCSLQAVEANVGALCESRSTASIATGACGPNGMPRGGSGGGTAPGGSTLTHAIGATASNFGFRQGDQSARASSPPQGGAGSSGSSGTAGAGAAFATARPDRDAVDLHLSAAAAAAVALTSLIKRRRGSKLADVKPVPHPARPSEQVNLHDAAAYLALRLCALSVEAPARAPTRPPWCSDELREAPVAFLHLAMAATEFLATAGIALAADTQRQFTGTLAVLLRAGGLVADAGRVAPVAPSPDASPSPGAHARFVDPFGDVSKPSGLGNGSIGSDALTTSGGMPNANALPGADYTPDVWNPHRRALLLAFRVLDVVVHSKAPQPPAGIIVELRPLKRQLATCVGTEDAVLRSAAETAWALATLPSDVLSSRQPALGAAKTAEPMTPALLGHIPAPLHALAALKDAVPMFHIDQAAWAARVAVAAAKKAVAAAAAATTPPTSLTAGVAGPMPVPASRHAPPRGGSVARAASPPKSNDAAANNADAAGPRSWHPGAAMPLWVTTRWGDSRRAGSATQNTAHVAGGGGGAASDTASAGASMLAPRPVSSVPPNAYPSVSGAIAVGTVVWDDCEGGEFFVPTPVGTRNATVPAFLQPSADAVATRRRDAPGDYRPPTAHRLAPIPQPDDSDARPAA